MKYRLNHPPFFITDTTKNSLRTFIRIRER